MAHLMHIFVLMISLYFRYRFTVTWLNFLSYSLLVDEDVQSVVIAGLVGRN
ncbi:hypothetical protein Hanom_Chr12g01113181 [Helianthus anomalus]